MTVVGDTPGNLIAEGIAPLRDQPVGRTAVGIRVYEGRNMAWSNDDCTRYLSACQSQISPSITRSRWARSNARPFGVPWHFPERQGKAAARAVDLIRRLRSSSTGVSPGPQALARALNDRRISAPRAGQWQAIREQHHCRALNEGPGTNVLPYSIHQAEPLISLPRLIRLLAIGAFPLLARSQKAGQVRRRPLSLGNPNCGRRGQ